MKPKPCSRELAVSGHNQMAADDSTEAREVGDFMCRKTSLGDDKDNSTDIHFVSICSQGTSVDLATHIPFSVN